MRAPVQPRRAARGSATVEFALIVPVLVTILLFGMYLTELVRAKLKLQEFSRYTVWEMTSYTLSDFARARHDEAFTDARQEMMREALERYRDMDSVEPNALPGNFIARYSDVAATLENKEIPLFDAGLRLGNGGEGFSSEVLSAANVGPGQLLGGWGFNTKGWVEAEARMSFNNVLLPQHYLDAGPGGFFRVDSFGGQELRSLELKSRFSMYADPWNLEDGSDATIRGRRAGAHRRGSEDHPHGLYQQVDRMVFLGARQKMEEHVGFTRDFRQFLGQFSPALLGTFVVSHNYGPSPGGGEAAAWGRECIGEDTGIEAYPLEAEGGLNNLGRFARIDWPRPMCFDTAPFRDQPYERSQYIQIFKARGEHFMGCRNPEAEDPSAPTSAAATRGDKNTHVVDCE